MSRDDSTASAESGGAERSPEQEAAPTTETTVDGNEEVSGAGEEQSAEDEQKPKRTKPKTTNARKTRTVELTLTVTGTADGEWQAELKQGSKWVARGLAVPAAAVSRAAKELHDELSAPIDDVINAAREQQQARVAQLEAELEQAKEALANLDET